ncbi:hypothetical protein COOONC_16081 [Cooperia oncophora]
MAAAFSLMERNVILCSRYCCIMAKKNSRSPKRSYNHMNTDDEDGSVPVDSASRAARERKLKVLTNRVDKIIESVKQIIKNNEIQMTEIQQQIEEHVIQEQQARENPEKHVIQEEQQVGKNPKKRRKPKKKSKQIGEGDQKEKEQQNGMEMNQQEEFEKKMNQEQEDQNETNQNQELEQQVEEKMSQKEEVQNESSQKQEMVEIMNQQAAENERSQEEEVVKKSNGKRKARKKAKKQQKVEERLNHQQEGENEMNQKRNLIMSRIASGTSGEVRKETTEWEDSEEEMNRKQEKRNGWNQKQAVVKKPNRKLKKRKQRIADKWQEYEEETSEEDYCAKEMNQIKERFLSMNNNWEDALLRKSGIRKDTLQPIWTTSTETQTMESETDMLLWILADNLHYDGDLLVTAAGIIRYYGSQWWLK